jgi:glycerate-2-kinase
VRVEENAVLAGNERFEADRVFVPVAGKAAGAMAWAAEELFGERIAGGIVVTKDCNEAKLERLATLFAAHPKPDKRGTEVALRYPGRAPRRRGGRGLLVHCERRADSS